MQTVTSFSASAVPRNELGHILADYVALDRARILRRSRVTWFGMLVVVAMVIDAVIDAFSPVEQWAGIGLLLFPPAWAWLTEIRLERRLTRRLEEVDGLIHQPVWAESGPAAWRDLCA